MPRRKMSMMNGVMATSGTDRNAIAMGINVCSMARLATTPMATNMAHGVPAMYPTMASSIVSPSWPQILARSAAAVGPVKR